MEEFIRTITAAEKHDNKHVIENAAWLRETEGRLTIRPILYPGTDAKRIWDRLVSISILVHLVANPLLLAFSDQIHLLAK